MSNRAMGYLAVCGAALLWGTLGVFFHYLVTVHGLAPLEVAFFRAGLSAALLAATLALRRPALLRVRARDLPFFLAFGSLGVAGLFVSYTYASQLTGVATAAVLLYTAPAWVTLIAWRVFGEPLTRAKLVALGLALVGCALVSGAYDPSRLRYHGVGMLLGLASGLTYGLYTLFGKHAAGRYSHWTAMLYALGLGGLCLLPWQSPAQLLASVRRIEVSAWLLGLSLGPTLGAYALLGTALERLPASVVSIVATLEPVIAAVLAWALLGQTIAPLQIVGGAGVLTSVLILRHAHDAGTPRGSQKQA